MPEELTLVSSLSSPQILRFDRVGFNEYTPQWVQRDTYRGHLGAVQFLNSNRTLAVGGFANTLMVIPFTAERSDDTSKDPNGVFSGLRSHRRDDIFQAGYPLTPEGNATIYEGFDFPYEINEDPNSRLSISTFSAGLGNNTESNFLTKNKNAWSVKFKGEEGYASYFEYGQESFNRNKKFEFSEEDNISWLMKTRDGGMIWAPQLDTSTGINTMPIAAVSDWIINNSDPDNILISTINGLSEGGIFNSGVFVTDDAGVTWSNATDVLPKVPVKTLEAIEGKVYAGTVGFGVFVTDFSDVTAGFPDWTRFESRFPTLEGLNIGVWETTVIEEDSNNSNRVLMGTRAQGILESLDGGASWRFDDRGLPTGNITTLKILEANPAVILLGLEDDGLYRKDPETNTYIKIIDGLPTTSNIRDIKIDTTFSDIFNEVKIVNPANDEILAIRADFSPPSSAPEDNVIYEVGNEIENATVVFKGNSDFSTDKFEDRVGTIRSGIPYYYRFFTINGDGTYTERDVIEGFSTLVETLKLTDENSERVSDPFPTTGDGLETRIVTPSTATTSTKFFEITSNTDTELFLRADPFKVINQGNATAGGTLIGGDPYRIDSTIVVIPTKINPIYLIAEDATTGISKVYFSGNNGFDWIERNIGITSTDLRTLTIENLNVERRLLLPQATLYVATADGVFRSEDNAATWLEISAGSRTSNCSSKRHCLR